MIIDYQIDNMKCGGCTATVEQALKGLSGCEDASVNLESGRARVSGNIDSSLLVRKLTELGYPARPIDGG